MLFMSVATSVGGCGCLDVGGSRFGGAFGVTIGGGCWMKAFGWFESCGCCCCTSWTWAAASCLSWATVFFGRLLLELDVLFGDCREVSTAEVGAGGACCLENNDYKVEFYLPPPPAVL